MAKEVTFFHFGRYQKFKLFTSGAEHEYINGRRKLIKTAKAVVFKDGIYKTSKAEEIAAIKEHPLFECGDTRNKITILDGAEEAEAKEEEAPAKEKTAEDIAKEYLKDDLIAIAEKNDIALTHNMKEVTIAQKLIEAGIKL